MLLPGKNICKTCLIITVLISSFLVTSRADDDGSLRLNIGLDFNGGSGGLRDASLHIRKFGGRFARASSQRVRVVPDEEHKAETPKQARADDSAKDSGDNKDDSSNNESDNKKEAEPKKSAEISAPKDKADKSESDDDSDSDINRNARVTKGLVDSKEEKAKSVPKVIEADKLDSDAEDGDSRRRRKREAGLLNPMKKRKNKKVGNARKLLFA